jgi:CRP-like cAMP-binding protein
VAYDVTAALAATDLFGGLGKRALDRLGKAATIVNHPAGKEILGEGQVAVGFHLILDGTAEVLVGAATRPELGPGDYFGEISLIDGKPRSAKVSAKTDLVTAALSSWSVKPLLNDEPEVTQALLLAMCARLRAVEAAGGSTAAG